MHAGLHLATLGIEVASREPLAAELDAFFGIVRTGGRPVVDGEDGLWAVAIATALLQANAAGRPVAPGDALAGVAAR